MSPSFESPALLNVKQASDFLNLKISRIRDLVFKNKIPYYKIGRTVMFQKSDLILWINQQKRGG